MRACTPRMKPVWDQALPSGSGGDTADQMQKMMCAANIRKNHAYVKARSLMAALYSLPAPRHTPLRAADYGSLAHCACRYSPQVLMHRGRGAWPTAKIG